MLESLFGEGNSPLHGKSHGAAFTQPFLNVTGVAWLFPGRIVRRVSVDRRSFLLRAAALVAAGPAAAQAPSWGKGSPSVLRLVAGPRGAAGKHRFGVEIALAPGFKTYWRSPGDSGVPPLFDWSGSSNVEALNLRWPVPERFADGAGSSIGYVGDIVFPASVQPVDPNLPIMLALKLDYAVCERICIPVKGEAGLMLRPGEAAAATTALAAFEARVPRPVALGEEKERIGLVEITIVKSARPAALALSLRVPEGGGIDDIFIEGPDMWSFGRPELTQGGDGVIAARIPVVDQPKGAAGPLPFMITVAGRPGPIEIRVELDIPAAKP